MSELPDALYTPEQVRALDRRAIEDHGIPGGVLMARAGRATWRLIRQRFPDARRVMVLCGGGNNGGDGYVIARLAADAGLAVDLCPFADPAGLSGDARRAANEALARVPSAAFSPERLAETDLVVDALLGTGLDRPVSGAMADAIGAVNASHCRVVAVDVPSGLSARTGQVMGIAVRAALTPTFIGLKQGLFTGEAADCIGEVVFDDLQVPAAVHDGMEPSARLLGAEALEAGLPRRPRTAHKGAFGHVLVIGGDLGMGGAVRIAGEAAARSGAGLTSVVTRPAHVAALLAARPELMVHGVEAGSGLAALLARADVLAVGPGLGQAEWGRALFEAVRDGDRPLVVDADGLNWLAQAPTRRDDWVLTPHPGEAARLLDTDIAEIDRDRFAAVTAIARQYGGVAVLKGAGTLISDGLCCRVCTEGNPGMASGGMGDALTGLIAGLRAQGFDTLASACLGVQAHARAADRAALDGERGLLAGDLLNALRSVVNP
ncbi:NAD(P)H-hydrate dehydratase [Spiribacter onubensis]|uniref:Bifunctional NAD(P)H-hydrate repair enzyme n=1 Tax=Spiribacter onubensis TaxID=3122420 RepID=A0ABV3S8V8_9GAMM